MKFAKSLLRNQVPEWSQSYIDYKGLKKLVKRAAQAATEPQKTSPEGASAGSAISRNDENAPFFYALDRNAEMVDTFYNSKFAEYTRRLRHIVDRFPLAAASRALDGDEVADLVGILLELRAKLRKLQWYAEVNKRGFAKILKKFDKKVGTRTQTRYFSSKILILGFANVTPLSEGIATANKYLNELAPEVQQAQAQGGTLGDEQLTAILSGRNSSASSLDHVHEHAVEFHRAIEAEDVVALEALYSRYSLTKKVVINLLLRALANHRNAVVPVILKHCDKQLEDPGEINNRNVVHRLIIHAGRKVQENKVPHDIRAQNLVHLGATAKPPNVDVPSDGTETSLALLMESLRADQHAVIAAPDQLLRTPLHYSARYGLPDISRNLLEYYVKWDILDTKRGITAVEWRDSEGLTPIDLAVEHNHPNTASVILQNGLPATAENRVLISPLLLKAVRLDSVPLLKVLLDFGCDVNFQDARSGESVLYVAAKYNYVQSAQFLISHGANMEIKEATFGWSPLFVAAVDGSQEIAETLIKAGARVDTVDGSGWTAKEHAALRGHIALSQLLPPGPQPVSPSTAPTAANSARPSPAFQPAEGLDINNGTFSPLLKPSDAPSRLPTPLISDLSIQQRRANHREYIVDEEPKDAIKTFGHGYLEDASKTLVLVTIGNKDMRYTGNPVEVDVIPLSQVGQTELDTDLSLVVSASHAEGEKVVIDLPTPEFGLSTEPIMFYTSNPERVQLHFDLVPTYSSENKVLGRAVAMLSTITKKVGASRTNLDDTLTLPIIEASTLRVLGTVTFNFMLVTPFSHPGNGIEKSSTYWRSLTTTRVIGHRGLGKNTLDKTSLQLGENTVESFIQAANLGASYVEFDVQLTKDHVPVIYHDFVVSDSGYDIPMHSLTLEQFMNIHQPPRHRRRRSMTSSADHKPHRSQSLVMNGSAQFDLEREDDENDPRQMRLTRDFKARGYKGNVRGHSIQSKFATLEELFKKLPQGVGFNIECKYPMMDECENEEMESVVIDINAWVDTVLKYVYDFKKDRDVIFSSFNPDVCALLSLKQPSIPVLFLTESGTTPMMDVRASSLQEAIRFAKCWNLLGIVSESTPLIDCPRLVGAVKNSGLVCFTYGALNNHPENARLQLRAGVDAVIVDSVMQVRKELTSERADEEAAAYISAYAEAAETGHGNETVIPEEPADAVRDAVRDAVFDAVPEAALETPLGTPLDTPPEALSA